MNTYVRSINPNAPLLGDFYKTLGEYYGIRGDVAFAQAMHETDYFRFTGDVRNGQNNFAGIGATGGGARGASFSTPERRCSCPSPAFVCLCNNFALAKPIPAG